MDKDNLSNISIPDSLLTKIFDLTGGSDGVNRGFYLFFINQNGDPNCIARPDGTVVRLALLGLMEWYPEPEYFSKSEPFKDLFDSLYHRTGRLSGANKGYIIFYIDDRGSPVFNELLSDEATYYALSSVVEDYQNLVDDQES